MLSKVDFFFIHFAEINLLFYWSNFGFWFYKIEAFWVAVKQNDIFKLDALGHHKCFWQILGLFSLF